MKKNYLKVLLAALCLLVGSNAWADDVYTTVYTRANVSAWTNDDLADWGGNTNLTLDATHGLYFNTTKPGSAYSATKSFTIADNAKVKYEVNWYTGNSTGRDSNFEYVKFGDKVCIGYNSNYHFYLSLTGSCAMTVDLTSQLKTPGTSAITIIFDTAKKKVESFSFRGTDITEYVADALEGNFNSVTFGFQRGGSTSNWAYPNGLESITVSQCEQDVSSANYTVNYKLGDAVVKTVSSSSVVGAEITADVAVDGEGDYAGNHYLITAENAPSMVLESGANVLDVPVRAPYTATLKVTTTVGTNEPQEVVTNLTETDTKVCAWSYAYPLYVKSGDVYYKVDVTTAFGEGGTFTDGQTIEKAVTYSTVDEDIVFFYDQATAGTNYTYTNGTDGNVGAQNARGGSAAIRGIGLITLDAGTYEFITYFTARNGRGLGIRDNDNATDPLFILTTDKNDAQTEGLRYGSFTLDAETSCVINGANSGEAKTNQSEDFDYIIIKKKVTSVTATIGDQGYSTFASAYALDLDNLPEGLEAYYVADSNVSDNAVTLTAAEGAVAAGEGLILKGEAGAEYSIPVADGDGAAIEGNYLVGVTTADGVDVFGLGKYVLVNREETAGVMFAMTFSDPGHQAQATAHVPAGKAYLDLSSAFGGAAKERLFISFDGEATAINAVEGAKKADNDVLYNLNGQRVDGAYKGIAIKAGKKVYVNMK